MLFPPQIQSATPYQLMGRKLTLPQPEPAWPPRFPADFLPRFSSAAPHQNLFLPEICIFHSSPGIKLYLSGSGHKVHCLNTNMMLVWQYFSGCILILSKLPSPRESTLLGTSFKFHICTCSAKQFMNITGFFL